MSSRKYTLFLSHLAKADIEDILAYTIAQWGENKAEAYKEKLDGVFTLLKSAPFAFPMRETIRKGIRIASVGKHIVVYRVEEQKIMILRVLHGRMNITEEL